MHALVERSIYATDCFRYSQGLIVAVDLRFHVIECTGRGEGESGRHGGRHSPTCPDATTFTQLRTLLIS